MKVWAMFLSSTERELQSRGAERREEDTARWTEEEDLRVREGEAT